MIEQLKKNVSSCLRDFQLNVFIKLKRQNDMPCRHIFAVYHNLARPVPTFELNGCCWKMDAPPTKEPEKSLLETMKDQLGPHLFSSHLRTFATSIQREISKRQEAKDPTSVESRGRPRKLPKRLKSRHEQLTVSNSRKEKLVRQLRCSRCGKKGHHKSNSICVFNRLCTIRKFSNY